MWLPVYPPVMDDWAEVIITGRNMELRNLVYLYNT
nr:MAG TPA: hypothetical protein [Bacteriophage sp.]